jgi:hypothetical protein
MFMQGSGCFANVRVKAAGSGSRDPQ